LTNTKKRNKKYVLLMITTKLGEKNVDKVEYENLLKLIELPIFAGCLGNSKAKALFITGKYRN
jgi:hypothetical protein